MPKTIPLWDTPPCQSPQDSFSPSLDLYPVDSPAPVGCILICPGGGYGGRAAHEGEPIALTFNEHGLAAAVVQYRVSPNRHPAPLLDASRAMRLLRKNARDLTINPDQIAILGFSAGGHLAGSLSTLYKSPDLEGYDDLPFSNRPDASILCYPVISSGEFAHQGSFKNLLGADASDERKAAFSLENQIHPETPPAFLWHTAEDGGVPAENSMLYALGLSRCNIPYELHIFPHGRHGLGLAPEDPHTGQWADLSVKWLKNILKFEAGKL